jgi:hypothetical protein
MPSTRSTRRASKRRCEEVLTARTPSIGPSDEEGAEALRQMLHRSPREFGKPSSLWTMEMAAEVSFEEGLTKERISGETVRATLSRMGVRWQRAKHWITSPDPLYERKKGGATD